MLATARTDWVTDVPTLCITPTDWQVTRKDVPMSNIRPGSIRHLGAVAGIRRKGLSDGLTLTRWRNAIFRVAGATN